MGWVKHRAGVGSVACPLLPPELPLLLGGYSCLFQFLHLGQERSNFFYWSLRRGLKLSKQYLKSAWQMAKKKKSKYFQSSSERKPLVRLKLIWDMQGCFFFLFLLWLRAYLKGKDVHISGTWSLKLRSLSRFFGFSLVFITMLPKCLKTQVPRTI